MTQVRTLLVAALAATVGLAVLAAPAAASTTCTYDAGTRRVTIRMEEHGTALLYMAGGRIHGGNGDRCGQATRANTDFIKVVGTATGSESLYIDLYNGRIGPGVEDEGAGLDEIEIFVDLKGTETDYTRESITITGTPVKDKITLGTNGVSLNGDDDVDVTFTGDMSGYPGRLDLTLAGAHGGDLISAQGGYGSGDPVTGYNELTIYGNTEHDVYADSPNTIRGGNGDDYIVAGGFTRNWIAGHDGNDVIFGANDADVLNGARGNDQLNGDNGNDRLLGGPGDDMLTGGADTDTVFGHEGNDDLDLGGDGGYVGDPAMPIQDVGDCGGGDLDEALIDPEFDQIEGCEDVTHY